MTIIDPSKVPERSGSGYPPEFRPPVAGRHKRALGDAGGLTSFGVNLTRLDPSATSSMRHWHTKESEFVYVLEGELTLVTDAGETLLRAGMAAAFPAGEADGHHFINRSDRPALYFEVGDRRADDDCFYPDIDLEWTGGVYRHKDGTPWEMPKE
jgi:uncharacterized cupin superfamily protein